MVFTEKKMLIIMGIIALVAIFLFGWYAVIPICGFLFALGGYKQKLWRRLGIALVALGVALLGYPGLIWWRYALVPIVYFGVLSMPYGENHSDLQRMVTGALMGLATIIFTTWWIALINAVIVCLGFQLIWYLSNKKGLTWKIAEGIIGGLLGLTLIIFRRKKK